MKPKIIIVFHGSSITSDKIYNLKHDYQISSLNNIVVDTFIFFLVKVLKLKN